MDQNNNQVVSYQYDAWGNILSIRRSLNDSVGKLNPYRYQGYRYDEETQLYYLQSRYYNSWIGCFLNSDEAEALYLDQGNMYDNNLFAYCLNNPVMNVDPSGFLTMCVSTAGRIIDLILMAIGLRMALKGYKVAM